MKNPWASDIDALLLDSWLAAPGIDADALGQKLLDRLTAKKRSIFKDGKALDVFYVQEVGGVRPTEERAAAAAHAVRTALGG